VADYTPCAYQCLESSACGYPSASATGATRKRAALPTPDAASSFVKRLLPSLTGDSFAKRTLTPTGAISNKADYVNEKATGKADELDWGFVSTQVVSANFNFDGTTALNKWMGGVTGCTAIAIVSRKGFWWTHLMEPGFIGATTDQVNYWNSITDALTNGNAKTTAPNTLANAGGIFEPSDDNPISIYVFSPSAAQEYDEDNDWEPLPLQAKYADRLDTLTDLLKGLTNSDGATPFQNADISTTYYEWPNENTPSQAVGKLVFEYDPEGTTDNTCQAVYRLWRNDNPTEVHFDSVTTNSKVKRQACSISSTASSSTTSSGSSTSSATSLGATSSSVLSTTASSTNSSSASATTAASTSVSSTSISTTSASTSSSPSPTSSSTATSTTASSSSTSTSTSTSTLPYSPVGSTGPNQNNRCHIHVWEYNLTAADDQLVAQIQLWDAAGNQMLAKTDVETIDNTGGYTWDCAIQGNLTVTGQASSDALSFSTSDVVFDSNADQIYFWCSVGGWATENSDEMERQMDCYFHCPWTYENGTVYPGADTLHNP
jgi:hypothetical protein